MTPSTYTNYTNVMANLDIFNNQFIVDALSLLGVASFCLYSEGEGFSGTQPYLRSRLKNS